MNWYAVHAKPRQETLARSSLAREGLETFYPKLRRRRTIRRVRKWVTGPLFPGYLFARFDFVRSSRLVKYANGVATIVSFGGKPAVVEDAILDTIRAHCQPFDSAQGRPSPGDPQSAILNPQSSTACDVVTLAPPAFQPGDLVEIQDGPLRGLQGVFERELSDRDRVVILLEVLAKGARVQITREQIEKV